MFYYFGRKSRLADLYPAPRHELVIEPFAGSMAYTLYHQPTRAIGIELDDTVVEVWSKICGLTAQELLDYPEPKRGDRTEDRWCMMAGGSHGTAKAKSYLWTERMERDLRKQKRMAARYVDYAKQHIEYKSGKYQDAPDEEATWFIDPPYQNIKRGYRRDVDYKELADWCKKRRGLVIVCEQSGADWLPFKPLENIKGTNNKRTSEVVWLALNGKEIVNVRPHVKLPWSIYARFKKDCRQNRKKQSDVLAKLIEQHLG